MQLRPRLTSASVSPWVATTLSSFTPTITPHPVPQKRHGAFDHLISRVPMPPATGCATAGTLMPAAAAATAAAWAFKTSRRERTFLFSKVRQTLDLLEHHVGREHAFNHAISASLAPSSPLSGPSRTIMIFDGA